MIVSTMKIIRPFLKWPGGKYRLVNQLKTHLPNRKYLIEPFVGAGALSVNVEHPLLVINDLNPDLINLYKHLKCSGTTLIRDARRFFTTRYNEKKAYYQLRKKFNTCRDEWERALLFLYLNRHGYNGLCRYNLKGGYNVPFGAYKNPYFPEDELKHFHSRIQNASLHCQDYGTFLDSWSDHPQIKQSVIYCDPPYIPLSQTANFTSYAGQRFTEAEQIRLAHYAEMLSRKGAIVLISNHDTPFTRKLYQKATLHSVSVTRSISCKGSSRQKIAELIACFEPASR